MTDWKKIIDDAKAITTELHKQAFLPMPPDQTGASAPPPAQGGQAGAPPPQQQGGMPPPQGGAPMPPPQAGGGAPPPQQGGMPPGQQQVTMDPMMRLDQLEQMVGEQGSVIQEMMTALGEDIGPALEEVMQKMTTHDNAILEVGTLANGATNQINSLTQELQAAMGGGGAPQQQPEPMQQPGGQQQ